MQEDMQEFARFYGFLIYKDFDVDDYINFYILKTNTNRYFHINKDGWNYVVW